MTSLSAIQENRIIEVMTKKINQSTTVLQNIKFTKEQKASEIFKILDTVFDYTLMSRITLSKKYRQLTREQKKAFAIAFERKLKASYIDKLSLYTDEQTVIRELVKVKQKRMTLNTDVIGKDDIFSVNYKFYKNKQNSWLIYDIELLGISIVQAYRKQFKEYLKINTVEQLIETM
jgi:phospholipid transport system substrate-binding protein